jgi:hypothetical protein
MIETKPKRSGLLLYFLIANLFTWLGWIPAVLITTNKGYPLPTMDYLTTHAGFQFVNREHFWLTVAFTLAVYGPLLGAILMAADDPLAGGFWLDLDCSWNGDSFSFVGRWDWLING